MLMSLCCDYINMYCPTHNMCLVCLGSKLHRQYCNMAATLGVIVEYKVCLLVDIAAGVTTKVPPFC